MRRPACPQIQIKPSGESENHLKFEINATDFRAALKSACEVAPSKGILPEQSCLYLCTEGEETLRIHARSDTGEISLSLAVPCFVHEKGAALIPSRMLLDYASMASGAVLVSTDAKQKATLKFGGKTSTIAGMEPDRFKSPDFSGEQVLAVSGEELAACLGRTSFCTGTDETRAMLCGVHLTIDVLGHTRFVGMNGYQVSMCDMQLAQMLADWSEPRELTVPNAVLRLISTQFGGESAVTLSLESYRASVSSPGKTLIFPLIAKEYVQYQRLIPESYSTELLANADDLLAALRLVEIASGAATGNDQRKNLICMRASGESHSVQFSADNDVSDAQTAVDCDMRGDDIAIYFNVKYIKDLVSACARESETVVIGFTGALSIACIRPQHSASGMTTYVVPVRTRA